MKLSNIREDLGLLILNKELVMKLLQIYSIEEEEGVLVRITVYLKVRRIVI
jgi:hypothetical protein